MDLKAKFEQRKKTLTSNTQKNSQSEDFKYTDDNFAPILPNLIGSQRVKIVINEKTKNARNLTNS